MPSAASLTPPTPVLPYSPAPKKTPRVTDADVQHEQSFFPHNFCRYELDRLSLRPAPPSIRLEPQSPTDSDHDTNSYVPQSGEAEDEYTISAYGDISLSEVMIPSLPPPTRPNSDVLHSTNTHSRLRLKVQRPPMPKRRPNYNYIADPWARGGGLDFDERWPGSPRPVKSSQSWLQHQPLMSTFPVDSPNPHTQGNKHGGASLDELLPHSSSIRFSPPGTPASQAIRLPQGGQKDGVKKDRPEVNNTQAKQPRSKPATTPAPAPLQEKPWRTRLPPRPPIPKWDVY